MVRKHWKLRKTRIAPRFVWKFQVFWSIIWWVMEKKNKKFVKNSIYPSSFFSRNCSNFEKNFFETSQSVPRDRQEPLENKLERPIHSEPEMLTSACRNVSFFFPQRFVEPPSSLNKEQTREQFIFFCRKNCLGRYALFRFNVFLTIFCKSNITVIQSKASVHNGLIL